MNGFPQYKAKVTVQAALIESVKSLDSLYNIELSFVGFEGKIKPTLQHNKQYDPKAGMYFLQMANGHQACLTAEEFLATYEPISTTFSVTDTRHEEESLKIGKQEISAEHKKLQEFADHHVGLWAMDQDPANLLQLFWDSKSDACPLEEEESNQQVAIFADFVTENYSFRITNPIVNRERIDRLFASELGQQLTNLYSTSDGVIFIDIQEANNWACGRHSGRTKALSDTMIVSWYQKGASELS